ncbi:MAG: DEAD/DEAH box helicase [Gemmataceae bacterium]
MEAPSGFQTLNLSSSVLSAVARAGYREPTPIQAALIPEAVQGIDVCGQAQTGTGKTAAFLLPFFHSWKASNEPGPQAIVLAPTRELVVQVAQEAEKLSPSKHFRTLAVYGGQRLGGQIRDLKQGVNLVVGTPGRFLDHLARGTLVLNRVRYVVLDEADRMLDIGFRPDIERILRRCPQERQTLLLSATMPDPVLRLAQRYMVDPVQINLSPDRITVDRIKQTYITVDEDRKFELLIHVLKRERPRQCIIFCARKRGADKLFARLRTATRRAAVMHGDLQQNVRNRIMQAFRDGKIAFLVATDVVGRGIDVTGISHIINYDLPEDPENYVHRIGRTGRMGADGVAIAFVTREQGEELNRIEGFINHQLGQDSVAGFEAARPVVAEEEKPRETLPVFGSKRVRRYSRRL